MSASEIRDNVQACKPLPDFTSFNPGYEMHAPSPRPALMRGEGQKEERSRGAPAPEFCSKKNEKLRARSRRMAAGGGTGSISIAPGSQKKIRKAKRRQTRKPSVRIYGCGRAPDLSSLCHVRGGQGGARSPVGVPPRRLRQRTNAAAQLQHALPGTRLLQALPEAGLSQSSELLADRSWCRPGVFPEPPGDGSDEPPPAGTALAPAAGVTGRPSCQLSEIRGIRIRNGD
jgi:hypothetical protein